MGRDRMHNNIWLKPSSYIMTKYLRITSFIRKLFLIYVFASDPSKLTLLTFMRYIIKFFTSAWFNIQGRNFRIFQVRLCPTVILQSVPVLKTSPGLVRRHTGRLRKRDDLLKGEGGGGGRGAESHDHKKAWSSINHSIPSSSSFLFIKNDPWSCSPCILKTTPGPVISRLYPI